MKRLSSSRYWPLALTLLMGVAATAFWCIGYPQALNFHEEFQMFLFDGEYLVERLAVPGGVAIYLGEFLVQFYNSLVAGAAIIGVLYMAVQRLTWRLMKTAGSTATDVAYYPLSFLPVVALWLAMGNESVLLTFTVALLLTLLAMTACPRRWRPAYVLMAVPVVYWAVGPLVLLAAVYFALILGLDARRRTAGAVLGLAVVAEAAGSIVLSSFVLPYPLERLCYGLGYCRAAVLLPVSLPLVALSVLLAWALARWLPTPVRRQPLTAGLLTAAVALGGAAVIPMGFDARTYELLDYDFLVRRHDWAGIVRKADQKTPDLPMSVCATNLALAMQGQLGERAFQYYQHGTQGLFPSFERNFTPLLTTGEAYFMMGLVNTAQRFAFESMEAVPNYAKSVRCVKRLAETNLINGQYDVARKYLKLLGRTVFYRKWAQRTAALMADEAAIAAHPLYGQLRQVRLTDDFLFSEQEIDKICGQLVVHDNSNMVAAQYLMLWPLLEGDVGKFMNYFSAMDQQLHYCPTSCQEAIVFAYAQKGQQAPHGYASDHVRRQFAAFNQALSQGGKDSPRLEAFRHTYWYYLLKGGN